MHQKIRREISEGILDLRPNLLVAIINFEPFVTPVTDMDATGNFVKWWKSTSFINNVSSKERIYKKKESIMNTSGLKFMENHAVCFVKMP